MCANTIKSFIYVIIIYFAAARVLCTLNVNNIIFLKLAHRGFILMCMHLMIPNKLCVFYTCLSTVYLASLYVFTELSGDVCYDNIISLTNIDEWVRSIIGVPILFICAICVFCIALYIVIMFVCFNVQIIIILVSAPIVICCYLAIRTYRYCKIGIIKLTSLMPVRPLMPSVKYKNVTKWVQADRLCCVCYDDFKEDDVLYRFPCGHHDHKECLNAWFSRPGFVKHVKCLRCNA